MASYEGEGEFAQLLLMFKTNSPHAVTQAQEQPCSNVGGVTGFRVKGLGFRVSSLGFMV